MKNKHLDVSNALRRLADHIDESHSDATAIAFVVVGEGRFLFSGFEGYYVRPHDMAVSMFCHGIREMTDKRIAEEESGNVAENEPIAESAV